MAMLLAKLTNAFSKKEQKADIILKLYKSALLLKCYDFAHENGRPPLKVDVNEMYDSLDGMSKRQLEKYIKTSLDAQVLSLFRCIKENSDRLYSYNERSKENAELLSDTWGCCPYLDASTAEGAGTGVFLKGSASAGSIVSIFPGIVHLREYVGKRNYIEENLLPDPHFFLMRRDDDVFIDARPSTLADATTIPFNPFALGHMLNHGTSKVIDSSSGKANVMQINYDFPNDTVFESLRFPKPLRPFIPNVYAQGPSMFTSDRSAMMRTVIFIANQPIESGSELFVDYKLKGSANFPLPSWYPPGDEYEKEKDEDLKSTVDGANKESDIVEKYLS